jgi:hypothetical protein
MKLILPFTSLPLVQFVMILLATKVAKNEYLRIDPNDPTPVGSAESFRENEALREKID